MIGAPSPSNEDARLLDLSHYEILDTPPEAAFDRITRLAARLLNTPVAVINFIDQDRQWGKSVLGLGGTTTPRHDSFCAWTILQAGPLLIENTHTDPRFAHNPMVTSEPYIHMYAGAPLTTPAGHCIGTLCVTDNRPHLLTPDDLQVLQDLADLVVDELELRARNLGLARELNAQRQRNADLQCGLAQAQVLESVTSLIDLDLTPEEMILNASALLSEALNADYLGLLVFENEGLRVLAARQATRMSPAERARPAYPLDWSTSATQTLSDLDQPRYLDDYPAYPGALTAMVASGVQQVAWLPLGTRDGVTALLVAVRYAGTPVKGWRGNDRALLEAVGRCARSALDRRLDAELARQHVRRDALTGLLNREALEQDLKRRQQDGGPFLLAELDLDGLTALHDQVGRAQGDRLLQVFASILKVELGNAGQVYRLGGDGFVVLGNLGEETVHDAVDAAVLAARHVGALPGVSVGFAWSDEGAGKALLALADERMQAVKRQRQAVRQQRAERQQGGTSFLGLEPVRSFPVVM